MSEKSKDNNIFPTASEDIDKSLLMPDTPQTRSPSYSLAYNDPDFLLRDELRSVRLQLELLKPEILQQENNIYSTIVIFGSARISSPEKAKQTLDSALEEEKKEPDDIGLKNKIKKASQALENSRYYEEAQKIAHWITKETMSPNQFDLVVKTGGGSGIMEAANRGAYEAGGKSVGLNIVLPFEQRPNAYITPELCFQFHYFAIRKMHFLKRAKALIVCPGGFGTLDELFETLTLIQTKKIKPFPVLLLGKKFWDSIINFEALVEQGMIDSKDLNLFKFVDSSEEAVLEIKNFFL